MRRVLCYFVSVFLRDDEEEDEDRIIIRCFVRIFVSTLQRED